MITKLNFFSILVPYIKEIDNESCQGKTTPGTG